jgi:hypothetical protein
MAITPAGLKRVTADQLPTQKLKTRRRITHLRPGNISQNIRLAATTGAGTRAAQPFQREIRFRVIVPVNGKLASDQLDV